MDQMDANATSIRPDIDYRTLIEPRRVHGSLSVWGTQYLTREIVSTRNPTANQLDIMSP